LTGNPNTRVDRTYALTGLVELYDAWHAAEPQAERAEKVAEWRAKLDELKSAPPP
jgi:hypothetical protein